MYPPMGKKCMAVKWVLTHQCFFYGKLRTIEHKKMDISEDIVEEKKKVKNKWNTHCGV
jgi:hypothetical protein